MAAKATGGGLYTFKAQGGHLWVQPADASVPAIQISLFPKHGSSFVVHCSQAPGPAPEALKVYLIVWNGVRHDVLYALIRDAQQVVDTKSLRLSSFETIISSAIPISKVTHTDAGVFISATDNALHYAQTDTPRAKVFQLAAGNSVGAAQGLSPLDDVIKAKDAIATFLSNLCDQLPKMAAAVETRVSQEILNALGAEIKAQQKNLGKIFDKPLTSFISEHNQKSHAAASANPVATTPSSLGPGATRRLLLEKLEVHRYLDPFAPPPPLYSAIPATVLAQAPTGTPDPMEALGKLFEPFNTLLNASIMTKLLNMGITDLLDAVSGTKPFSSVLDDFFNVFKIDDAMNAFHNVFSRGQFSKLVGQLPLKSYLEKPVQNAFFIALYKHYFPGKTFTTLDLIAFLGALIGYVAFEVLGKASEFQSVFADKQSLAEFTNAPATLVSLISGKQPEAHGPMTVNAVLANAAPPVWRIAVASALSGTLTLFIGIMGVLSFGTGLMASPIVGGMAAGVSQGLFGMVQNLNTDDVKWDLLSGFAGGFSGAFLSTLIGNTLFGMWAQRGNPPSARIQKLKMIMIGFVLTLGGGGGAVVSALVKNYAKTGKLDFVDPLALTTGGIGGLGGGAMGCGLHMMGGLSGSKCLPVALSLTDANALAMAGITGVPPIQLNNAAALPAANAAFPVALPNLSMGVYETEFLDAGATPSAGGSIALVTWDEFSRMDASYTGCRERLFWLESAALGVPPPANRRADLVVGIHGIGRYVFPVLTHRTAAGGTFVNFSRPMFETDFAQFLAARPFVTACLNPVRATRLPIVKLMICFSALPLGCCSLGQVVATTLNAIVYAGRPPVYPWLDNGFPRVPGWGGWIQYTP